MSLIHHTYITKNNKTIIVRNAINDDATALIVLKKGYIKGCDTIPMFDYEYKNTPLQEVELITRYTTEENSILLVAEYDGVLIGNIDLTGNQRKKMLHTSMLGMGIAKAWQNTGVGNCLMQSAFAAIANSPISIVWLEVYATNLAGLKLYEKSGFKQSGIIKNFFNEVEPTHKITMVKYIK
ncbi:MAG: hypothetical protein BM557_00310 [Flavobacterium sp. MedPE-SWcel]|uniref:GNAT family N-acetyltransferase n=1 Tax=uncultured Flavobacterium sp. TaxID=165435 RepID=UPI000922993D|nr:GNAT family N-acetyltransferase [uncultured Flavobacterium sp.]OIQ22464.1 MAG: hypothetical protein BM557_00310 [Flavobacterium sp. MedPE-SWcel]